MTVRYEFDILECGREPSYFLPNLKNEAIVDNQCFYILSAGKWGTGSNFALTVAEKDKYYPLNYGLYDIGIDVKKPDNLA